MTKPTDAIDAMPYALPAAEVSGRLGVDPDRGLSAAEAEQRAAIHGPNELVRKPSRALLGILADQFKSLITALLATAAALSIVFQSWTEAAAILAVIVINGTIGFLTEWRATRSMEALRGLTRFRARVRRDGQVLEIPTDRIVPGDIAVLEAGDIVPADLRLAEASRLQCDESVLTGESLPIEKRVDAVSASTILAERRCMAYQGTAVTRGSGLGIVVATGMEGELGRIASLVEQAVPEETPLERRIEALSRQLVWLTLGLAAVIAAAGIATGKPVFVMLEVSIALAVAAVPEGLPMVTTLVLARGMWRMARRNALIGRLSAVETLGATTVILTDKTGTLTENRMTATRLYAGAGDYNLGRKIGATGGDSRDLPAFQPGSPAFRALEIGALCNNAELTPPMADGATGTASGDPTERALLSLARRFGIEKDRVIECWPRIREDAFDPDLKMMATVHGSGPPYLYLVKGAPESVLAAAVALADDSGDRKMTEADRQTWRERAEMLAGEGLRVLALASKQADTAEAPAYSNLTLCGLVGLDDPPRADVATAIAACQEAGIRIVMVTGDHAATAGRIAASVGLSTPDSLSTVDGADLPALESLTDMERADLTGRVVFARVSPSQKLDLIRLFQEAGEIVAMTGDGVNDAPALRKADIGVAMGRRGSQVAREAADMVLRDDAIATIAVAIEQGRVIFANIRKFLIYLLSCNLSEILIVGLAALMDMPLPLLPLQILYLNLITDVFPAFALGACEGEKNVMTRGPRPPTEQILERRHWTMIAGYASTLTVATLGAFSVAMWGLGITSADAVTVSFVTLALGQLWHVFNMRERGGGLVVNEITRNPWVWGSLLLCCGLVGLAVFQPQLASVLGLAIPTPSALAVALGFSFLPLVAGQMVAARPFSQITGRCP